MAVHRVVDLAVNAALDVKWIREALDVGVPVDAELPSTRIAEVRPGVRTT